MNNEAPIREPAGAPGWVLWFKQVLQGLSGWNQSMHGSVSFDFGLIAAGAQASTTVTVRGARSGAAVIVTPSADVAGIIFTGVVSANDTVTLYAKNHTSGAINPPITTFRVIVLQG